MQSFEAIKIFQVASHENEICSYRNRGNLPIGKSCRATYTF